MSKPFLLFKELCGVDCKARQDISKSLAVGFSVLKVGGTQNRDLLFRKKSVTEDALNQVGDEQLQEKLREVKF